MAKPKKCCLQPAFYSVFHTGSRMVFPNIYCDQAQCTTEKRLQWPRNISEMSRMYFRNGNLQLSIIYNDSYIKGQSRLFECEISFFLGNINILWMML